MMSKSDFKSETKEGGTAYEYKLTNVMVKSYDTSGDTANADSFDFRSFPSDQNNADGLKDWIPLETMFPPINHPTSHAGDGLPVFADETDFSGTGLIAIEWTY